MHDEIEEQILWAVEKKETFDEVQKALSTVLEEFSHGRIGYVSGIVSVDGPEKIPQNLRRLQNFARELRKKYGFPIFSPGDVFPAEFSKKQVEGNKKANEDFVRFWRVVLTSGYITDLFMTLDWERSPGATDEHRVAQANGIKIHYL